MPILIDYICTACGVREERWAPSPPPAGVECLACGAAARRAWAPVGLHRHGSGSAEPDSPAATPGGSGSSGREPRLCQRYPQIPGLCHMTPSAQRRWVAAYTRDSRARDRELAHQENAAAAKAPTMADAISHQHAP